MNIELRNGVECLKDVAEELARGNKNGHSHLSALSVHKSPTEEELEVFNTPKCSIPPPKVNNSQWAHGGLVREVSWLSGANQVRGVDNPERDFPLTQKDTIVNANKMVDFQLEGGRERQLLLVLRGHGRHVLNARNDPASIELLLISELGEFGFYILPRIILDKMFRKRLHQMLDNPWLEGSFELGSLCQFIHGRQVALVTVLLLDKATAFQNLVKNCLD